MFIPHDVSFSDDAAHYQTQRSRVETWYYDGLFDNGYSMAFLINIFKLGRLGMALTGLYLYKDTTLIKTLRQRLPLDALHASPAQPQFTLRGASLLSSHQDPSTDTWNTHIKYGDENTAADLQLTRSVKAWAGTTSLGGWLAIPRLQIHGTLSVDGRPIPVSGHGYHDHNQFPVYAPLYCRAYQFGRVSSGTLMTVWGRIIHNFGNEEHLLIVCTDTQIANIPAESQTLSIQREDHRTRFPLTLTLQAHTPEVDLDLTHETIGFHFLRLPGIQYWRAHVRTTGTVRLHKTTESFDRTEISDYVKFA